MTYRAIFWLAWLAIVGVCLTVALIVADAVPVLIRELG
jgi:hypothetical protein